VNDLPLLSFGPWERFVVGHLRYKLGNVRSEHMQQIILRHTCVLDDVVQERSDHEARVRFGKRIRGQSGHLQQMVDVRFLSGAPPPLCGVSFGCEASCPENVLDGSHFTAGFGCHFD
jgi:hypothetical protein